MCQTVTSLPEQMGAISLKNCVRMPIKARLSTSTNQNAGARSSRLPESTRTHPRRRQLTKDDLAVGPGVP
jgi:hypothetical protein